MLTAAVGAVVAVSLSAVARRSRPVSKLGLLRATTPTSPSRARAAVTAWLSPVLARAAIRATPSDAVVTWLAGVGVVGVLALSIAGPVGATLAAGGGLAAGPSALWALRHRREDGLRAAVPDLLDEAARELRAGGTVRSALERVSRRPGLLADEAHSVVRRVELGLSNEEALIAWAASHADGRAARPIRAATAGLQVALAAGGPAAGSLEALAAGMRDEAAVLAEARAQSAQGRLSAVVLGALPVGSLVLSAVLDPGSFGALVANRLGRYVLMAGVTLDAVGLAWMRRIVRVVP